MSLPYVPIPDAERRSWIEANRSEYGEAASRLRWVLPEEADRGRKLRQDLLEHSPGVHVACRGTKPHRGPLSPGCRICAAGGWSCLFINGRCNCRCFYCPAGQDEVGIPTTQTVTFDSAGDYADYVRLFGYTGVSISGGEPLMTFRRTVKYIERVRRVCGGGVHIWLYTNGTLLTKERAERLRGAGLDEIRIDIGAGDYELDAVRGAAGTIPLVTVEIPAVPEDVERVKSKLVELREAGVGHLNLHQLRLTPHNLGHMIGRPYRFLHGERVTVLDSELAALEILNHADATGVDLPIHYCSFVYKHRYQQAAARRRCAGFVIREGETITENGYIRSTRVDGEAEGEPVREERWRAMDLSGRTIRLAWFHPVLRQAVSYRHFFREIPLNADRRVVVEKQRVAADLVLEGPEAVRLREKMFGGDRGDGPEVWERWEVIRPGLQDYY